MIKPVTFFAAGALTITAIAAFFAFSTHQNADKKPFKVVFQMSTPDTSAFRALTRQLNNVLDGVPNAQIEVVAHNKGIAMLQTQKSNVTQALEALKKRGVQFVACEQTLKQQNLEKSAILPLAGFVPRGLVEIIEKQNQGWAYIKGGF